MRFPVPAEGNQASCVAVACCRRRARPACQSDPENARNAVPGTSRQPRGQAGRSVSPRPCPAPSRPNGPGSRPRQSESPGSADDFHTQRINDER